MSHPRIEEVSDSDMSDPSEGDIDDFAETDILRARTTTATTTTSSSSKQAPPSSAVGLPQLIHPSQNPSTAHIQPADIKGHQMLYPVYFDAARSRRGGRRVASSLAVRNPLARTIAGACAALRLRPVLEAHRAHPRDWANPGRVRVRLHAHAADPSDPDHNPFSAPGRVKNKHHLYLLVAQYLRENPTTEDCEALQRMRGGVPMPGDDDDDDDESGADGKKKKKTWPRPAIPRGWENKMGDLLPAYSAAMTGGGVSENAFKDMMKEMQGAGGGGGGAGGMPGLPGGITPEMMNMFGGMGGLGGMGGGMGGGGAEASGGGGGKKGKKGKGKA